MLKILSLKILKALSFALGLLFTLLLVLYYKAPWDILQIILYILFFIIFPIIVFMFFRKNENIRKPLLICVIILLLFSVFIFFGRVGIILDNNFENYLIRDTDFEKAAATVMPTKQSLSNATIVFYEYEKISSDDQIIRLSVAYSEEEFNKSKLEIEEQYKKMTQNMNNPHEDDFYFDGIRYYCFTFYDNGYCAMAYHICPETRTISYLFCKNFDLQTMTVEAALTSSYSDRAAPAP